MTFVQRFLGAVLFKSATYRYVASNSDLNLESFLIVVTVSFANSFAYTLLNGVSWQSVSLLFLPIILGWVVLSWLSTWIANKLFKVKVSFANILRARGYTHLFSILIIVSTILGNNKVGLIASYLVTGISFAADVLSVREASETSTSNAFAILFISTMAMGVLLLPLVIFQFALRH